jgi:hypothetical protein
MALFLRLPLARAGEQLLRSGARKGQIQMRTRTPSSLQKIRLRG